MSTVVMSMDVLIPFVVIVGLTLTVFAVAHVVDGYEAPASAKDSSKRILASTGGWTGGFLIAQLAINGLKLSEQVWAGLLGALTAFGALFVIDMMVLHLKSRRRGATDQDD